VSKRTTLLLEDWKSAVIPGLFFLSVETQLVVYGKILQLHKDGFLWTLCYNQMCEDGEETKLHYSELAIPLSIEQFKIARRLRWPSNEHDITRILTLPPD